jgi:hypothetical protein
MVEYCASFMIFMLAANMFSPFGYSIKTVYDQVRGQLQTKLAA